MIKIDFKLPSHEQIVRAAMVALEADITKKAKSAAARHGGVTVKFDRKADGAIQTVKFEGSEAAIAAARASLAR
jgi:hypothetical protein